ncbi:SH3 domain-containing protein [Gymnodinialimonas hymeniacidonis]|uniref:SH3 domain-containing protein n=1 Tax=Gymnodinialimonas hymeniacidonis TaxID=3126508 RepID=UPI0034C692F0
MRFVKATALALVAALSVNATAASATGYGQQTYPQYGYGQTHTVNYHGHGGGYGHSNWGHYNNYSWYHVSGVSYYDHLNVRSGPGVRNHVVYALAHNAYGVQLQDCTVISTSRGPSRWCLVAHNGHVRGWVNARFLAQSH